MCDIERFAIIELQMRRQGEHKEAINGPYGDCAAVIFCGAKLVNGRRRGAERIVHIEAQTYLT